MLLSQNKLDSIYADIEKLKGIPVNTSKINFVNGKLHIIPLVPSTTLVLYKKEWGFFHELGETLEDDRIEHFYNLYVKK